MSATLRVNECRLFATGRAADWWAAYLRASPEGRCVVVDASIGGFTWDVPCEDRAHAEFLRDRLLDVGAPASALTIRA